MPSSRSRPISALLASLALLSCGGPRLEAQTLQPPPPAANGGRPVSDPPPSRIVIHATIFRDGLAKKLAESLPRTGEGDAQLFGGQTLHYTWTREPLAIRFDRGRVVVGVTVHGRFNMLGEREMPITVTIAGEPVMTADFKALLQSSEVQVVASGPVEAVNRAIEGKLKEVVGKTLDEFRYDVRPLMVNAFSRLARPIEIPVGDQVACAELKVTSLEAAPTVLADGFEKDLGIVVMPSVTLPCTPVASLAGPTSNDGGTPTSDGGAQASIDSGTPGASTTQLASYTEGSVGLDGGMPRPDASVQPATYAVGPTSNDGGTGVDAGVPAAQVAAQVTMPLLQNVSTLPSGPFKVVIPVAARYEELSKALESSMKGRLYFSASHPELYMEKPQVYPSDDTVVIKMNLGGNAKVGDYSVGVGGELYFAGHPHVIDNQLSVPDLEITPGTASELVKLKFAMDYQSIRDQARQALRVDVSERLAAVKDKMSTEVSFADDSGCARGQVLRTEVTGVYPHPNFLRIYVAVDAQLGLYMPCKK